MSNKYTTLKMLEGYKMLDLKQHLLDQENRLDEFKKQFDGQTATDEKFFKAKEDFIKQQKEMINGWIKLIGVENTYKTNLAIHLMISEEEAE